MSTLKQKTAAHLKQCMPTDYDEDWVNTLLTESDAGALEQLKKNKQAREAQRLRERENKAQNKAALTFAKDKPSQEGLSAIEKQIKAYREAQNAKRRNSARV